MALPQHIRNEVDCPALVSTGFLMHHAGSQAAMAALCLWNLVTLGPQVLLLKRSINCAPHLRHAIVPQIGPTSCRLRFVAQYSCSTVYILIRYLTLGTT